MNFKTLFFATLFLAATGLASAQNEPVAKENLATNGQGDYWLPSENELLMIFKKEYRSIARVNHGKELQEHPLLVRLEDDARVISMLEKAGKTKAAEIKKERVKAKNLEIIQSMQDNYNIGEYYFYYPKDIDKLFTEKDFSVLYKDGNTKAENIAIKDLAYVLIYKSGLYSHDKRFKLHLWDMKKVSLLKGQSYIAYKNWYSEKKDFYKSIQTFVKGMKDYIFE